MGARIQPEVIVRVSKKLAIRIPKALAEAVGLRGGGYVKLRIESGSRVPG